MEIQIAGITERGAGMENKRSMGSEYEKKAAEYLKAVGLFFNARDFRHF